MDVMKTLGELYSACLKHLKEDFLLQDGYLFKGMRLCIPKCETRELLIKEVHGGSLVGHYGQNKALIMLMGHYYWLGMSKDVQDIRRGCATHQVVKSHSLSHRQYTPLLVPTFP